MKWTKAQENAITDRGRSLLVSAGAGSGKTSVLAERLVRILIDENASIDDFLVVTFTDAAAADLKEKLYGKLSQAIAESPDNARLYKQLFLLSGAKISTISSFCFGLVKRNFNVLGLSPRSTVADDAECAVMRNDVLNSMINEYLSAGDAEMKLLRENFCVNRNEKQLADVILTVYSGIRVFAGYEGFFDECLKKLAYDKANIASGLENLPSGKILMREIKTVLKTLLADANELYEYVCVNAESCVQMADSLIKLIESLCECTSCAGLLSVYRSTKIKNAALKVLDGETAKYVQDQKAAITKLLKETVNLVDFGGTESALIERETEVLSALKTIVLEFDKRYTALKRRKALLDFSDLEQLTLKLLQNPDGSETALCKALKRGFRQVFIDEYQDVNPLQDTIFSLLSNGSNKFIVGDVKQSIYRFRNAYPEIFIGYKNSYADFDDKKSSNAKVFLRENFRCPKPVIDFVNLITGYAAGDDSPEYKDEKLVLPPEPLNKARFPVTVAYAVCGEDGAEEANERAIDYVTEEIKRLVASGNYRYKDIALMFSALKGIVRPYENAFRRAGIPFTVTKSNSFLSSSEVTLALCCLSAIDNPTDDVALFSMMRSPAYGFDSQTLYRARTANDAYSLCTCLRRFAAGTHLKKIRGIGKFKLKIAGKSCDRAEIRVKQFLRKLDLLRAEALGTPTQKLLWSLYERTNLLSLASSGEKGAKGRENLLQLYEYASAFEKSGYKGLSAFCAYIEQVGELGEDVSLSSGGSENEDCVHIMSIHKAKGLEYPVCFCLNMNRQFKFPESSSPVILSRETGITFSIHKNDGVIIDGKTGEVSGRAGTVYDTFHRLAASCLVKREGRAEELRKLYVALTRAQERLYVVGSIAEDYGEARSPSDANSFMGYVLGALKGYEPDFVSVIKILRQTEETALPSAAKKAELPLALPDTALFEYGHISASALPAKVSVSELRKGLLEEEEYFKKKSRIGRKKPVFEIAEPVKTAADAGTSDHLFMQFCDMSFAASNGAGAEAERLLKSGFITEEQFALLDIQKLDAFFSGSLYAEMSRAKRIYREKRFSLLDNCSLLGGDKDEELLVQGVIDCFFVAADGKITVVDYKTDKVFGDGGEQKLLDRHKVQLGYYVRAVEMMTNLRPSRALLYSFSLGKAVEMPLD